MIRFSTDLLSCDWLEGPSVKCQNFIAPAYDSASERQMKPRLSRLFRIIV